MVEVMTEVLDSQWWKAYIAELASRFGQEELIARAMAFESLTARFGDPASSRPNRM
jgi:hypothetical protein